MNRVMTTGQVARVFNVNINTVIKWFDEGKLEGFRLPRSNERRIYRESVQAFMKLHGITDDLLRVYEENRVVKKRGRKPGCATPGSRCIWIMTTGDQCRNGRNGTSEYCKIHIKKTHIIAPTPQ